MLRSLVHMLNHGRPARRVPAPMVLAAVALLVGCGSSTRPETKGVGSSGDGAATESDAGRPDAREDAASMTDTLGDTLGLDVPGPAVDASGDAPSAGDAPNAVDAPNTTDAASDVAPSDVAPSDVAPSDVAPSDVAPSDIANGCIYGGTTYAPGSTFSSFDGCNICTCGANGSVGCTKIACADAGTTPTCTFDGNFRFWNDGGFRAYADESKVAVPHTLTVTRDRYTNAPPASCAREIPCTSAAEVDVAEIKQALAHADVVAALATTAKPFYGVDNRPADGTVFMFERGDGRGFSLGSGTTVPAGLRALEQLLLQAQSQTIASSACVGPAFRP